MTQQLIYQAVTCMLRATLTMSSQLEESRAKQIRKQVSNLQKASTKAFERRDAQQLRSLCHEVMRLGDAMKTWLKN